MIVFLFSTSILLISYWFHLCTIFFKMVFDSNGARIAEDFSFPFLGQMNYTAITPPHRMKRDHVKNMGHKNCGTIGLKTMRSLNWLGMSIVQNKCLCAVMGVIEAGEEKVILK